MKKHFLTYFKIQSKGFSLVETLVALTLFSVCLAALMTITARGIGTVIAVKQEITARYLAQDALEGFRFLRDTLPFGSLLTDINGNGVPLNTNSSVIIDTSSGVPSIVGCGGSTNCGQLYKDTNGFFTHTSTGAITDFSRTVRFQEINNEYIEMEATVRWNVRGVERSLTNYQILTSWPL
jgi:prepilin-type N-terminal cleavage/methylation domain-containing protein